MCSRLMASDVTDDRLAALLNDVQVNDSLASLLESTIDGILNKSTEVTNTQHLIILNFTSATDDRFADDAARDLLTDLEAAAVTQQLTADIAWFGKSSVDGFTVDKAWSARVRGELFKMPLFRRQCSDMKAFSEKAVFDKYADSIEISDGALTFKATPDIFLTAKSKNEGELKVPKVKVGSNHRHVVHTLYSLIQYSDLCSCLIMLNEAGHPVILPVDPDALKHLVVSAGSNIPPERHHNIGYLNEPLPNIFGDDDYNGEINDDLLVEPKKKTYMETIVWSMYNDSSTRWDIIADAFYVHGDTLYTASSLGYICKIHMHRPQGETAVSTRMARSARITLPGFQFKTVSCGLRLVLLTAYSDARQANTLIVLDDCLRLVARLEDPSNCQAVYSCVTMFGNLHLAMLMDASMQVKVFALHAGKLTRLEGQFTPEAAMPLRAADPPIQLDSEEDISMGGLFD